LTVPETILTVPETRPWPFPSTAFSTCLLLTILPFWR
jgi:hypothetical protein